MNVTRFSSPSPPFPWFSCKFQRQREREREEGRGWQRASIFHFSLSGQYLKVSYRTGKSAVFSSEGPGNILKRLREEYCCGQVGVYIRSFPNTALLYNLSLASCGGIQSPGNDWRNNYVALVLKCHIDVYSNVLEILK